MVVVYVLRSIQSNYQYVGMTSDLLSRFKRHNRGGNKSTKAYAPFNLVYQRQFDSHSSARVHEKFLKTGKGREFLKDHLRGSLPDNQAGFPDMEAL